jgi:orotate phosphoribosyltransferase
LNPLTLVGLAASGAHQQGHFLLSSGLHSGDYLQCALHLALPRRAAEVGEQLAARLAELAGERIEMVVAPALGGIIVGHETARALRVPFVFTERVEAEMALRRGFAVAASAGVVVVEDVVTTGRSTREVIALLQAAGTRVLAVGSMVNRSGGDPFAPIPYGALLEVSFPTWSPEMCPLCRDGAPFDKPGSRPVTVHDPG